MGWRRLRRGSLHVFFVQEKEERGHFAETFLVAQRAFVFSALRKLFLLRHQVFQ